MLTYIDLEDFRNHARSHIELDRLNLLLGPNGAGKTSVLDAVTFALAGANHLTTTDGKFSQGMIRQGAKSLTVRVGLDSWGEVIRTRNQQHNGLVIPGAASDNAAGNQALLLERLGVPQETLMALLDA